MSGRTYESVESMVTKVAWVFGGDIRPYRVPFLRRLGARSDIDIWVYAGQAQAGFGAPERPPEVDVEVKPVRNLFWPGGSGRVAWQRGLVSVLWSDREVIVCSEIVSNLSVWLLRLLHRPFRKEFVLVGYFYRPQHEFRFSRLRSFLRRFLRSSSSALIPYTDRGRAECIDEGVPGTDIFVMRNTLDTEELLQLGASMGQDDSRAVREELGLGTDRRVIAYLGRLRSVKRLDVLIDAMGLLVSRTTEPPFLVVIGDGPDREELMARADGLPVKFVGSVYDEKTIARFLSVAEIMVLPGQVGLTCIHGFASALPCITADAEAVTQSPEYEYLDKSNSVVLPSADPESFAHAIERLLSDDLALSRLREGALRSAQRLSMDAMVAAFAAATHHAVGRTTLRS